MAKLLRYYLYRQASHDGMRRKCVTEPDVTP